MKKFNLISLIMLSIAFFMVLGQPATAGISVQHISNRSFENCLVGWTGGGRCISSPSGLSGKWIDFRGGSYVKQSGLDANVQYITSFSFYAKMTGLFCKKPNVVIGYTDGTSDSFTLSSVCSGWNYRSISGSSLDSGKVVDSVKISGQWFGVDHTALRSFVR